MFCDDRIDLIRSPHKGPSSARNLGLDAAERDFILMLDSDDVLDRTGLEMLVDAAQAAAADVAVGGWIDFDTPAARQVILPRQRYGDPYANCVEQMWITGTALLRNSRMPRFNETRMPWEALEFYLDYLAEGRSAVYVNNTIVNSRQHEKPDRLTIRHNHFEPRYMGDFFAEKKKQLKLSGLLNDERIAALDKRILSCVHSLLRQGLEADAHRLFSMVNWGLMTNSRVVQSRVVCLVVTGFRFRRSESIYCREPRARTWLRVISIIIPFLNAEAWLAEAVESALGQTGLNSEIVCVDNGSTDGSLGVARRFEPAVRVIACPSGGVSAARNRGIAGFSGNGSYFSMPTICS